MRFARLAPLILGLAGAATAHDSALSADPTRSGLIGTWSFDGTCASGDGMTLEKDGDAGYDEWGSGLWALTDGGKRLVLILRVTEMGRDEPEPEIKIMEAAIAVVSKTRLHLTFIDDNRKVTATRCP
jgi:hypothetical protein